MSRFHACRRLLTLMLAISLFWCLPKIVKASNPPAAAAALDADGDDPRTELLYHWQDKRFSDEERNQIVICTLMVATLFAGGAVQRRRKLNRHL